MPQTVPSRPFRVVALDLDGTVLDASQRPEPGLKELLAHLSGLSVRTVVCTGRRWRTTVPVLKELEHAHPAAVCAGGALVKRADDQETLLAVPMPPETGGAAAALFRKAGLVPILLYDGPLDGRELRVARADRSRAEGLSYLAANAETVEWYDGDCPGDERGPLAVYTVDDVGTIAAAAAGVREGLGERAVVEEMKDWRYGRGGDLTALEVHAPDVTKWRGLEWLLRRWGMEAEDVVAVGDDVNDIPMLRAAGLSFAMAHAPDEVKAAADAVTSGADRCGVAQALRSAFGL